MKEPLTTDPKIDPADLCKILLYALRSIEKLPRDQTGHSLMRAHEIAREAIAWTFPPKESM